MSSKTDVKAEYLYLQMLRARLFEVATSILWSMGLISGELHLGTGEEAIAAGIVTQLERGDALLLDHRSTPPIVCRGINLKPVVLELLGSEEGLCGGRGGHMHLFSKEWLFASSGIVGSSAPLAVGFGLADRVRNSKNVAVSFFGEGAANQGMLLESLNLASAYSLPIIFVCKDNSWAITTRSRSVTGGRLRARAIGFGIRSYKVNGSRVEDVYKTAREAIARARSGRGPSFIIARCARIDGHFLGDPLLRVFEEPSKQIRELMPPLLKGLLSDSTTPFFERLLSLLRINGHITFAGLERYVLRRDPLTASGAGISIEEKKELLRRARDEIESAVSEALSEASVSQINLVEFEDCFSRRFESIEELVCK